MSQPSSHTSKPKPAAKPTPKQNPDLYRIASALAGQKIKELCSKGLITVTSPIDTQVTRPRRSPAREHTFTPRMDVLDDPSSPNIMATFELPGVKASDMSLSILDGHLIIQGERRSRFISSGSADADAQPNGDASSTGTMDVDKKPSIQFPVRELRYGRFYRSFKLSHTVQQTDISASMVEGMLTVTWPRSKPDLATEASAGSGEVVHIE
ncbi:HSP20-like chaperone [Desarmillaria tabescens]|uniref:HSP20-like chaperone n=1 Tax=Armillaria tabescens TaxID=1929756 RepID=A0AA39TVC1_ARMTA|nr:HSP20-like chaperone [Desarmillaria tabescens]KAK0460740.1 HSP20-like chaperone [Desarmillaria tabescens]